MDLPDLLLEDMDKFGIVPSNFTLGILVKMYGRHRQLHRALKVVKELPARHGFLPNAQVWTCLMCTCINNNGLREAFEVFEDLKKHSQGIDAKAYGVLISGCVRYGQLAKAVALVDEAYGLNPKNRTGTPPRADRKDSRGGQVLETATLEHLLHGLAQKGMMEDQGVPLLNRLRAANAPVSGHLLAFAMGGGNDRRRSEDHKAVGGHGGSRAQHPWEKDRY
jgi:pentatricopeptide repeat protein